jgi:hypothetical protein
MLRRARFAVYYPDRFREGGKASSYGEHDLHFLHSCSPFRDTDGSTGSGSRRLYTGSAPRNTSAPVAHTDCHFVGFYGSAHCDADGDPIQPYIHSNNSPHCYLAPYEHAPPHGYPSPYSHALANRHPSASRADSDRRRGQCAGRAGDTVSRGGQGGAGRSAAHHRAQ